MSPGSHTRPTVPDACIRTMEGLELPAFILTAGGVVSYANPAWVRAFGEPARSEWGWLSEVATDERSRVRAAFERGLASAHGVDVEYSVRRSDGAIASLWCSANPLRGDGGERVGLLCLHWDVTAQRRQEERLAFMAGHDPLTGLANRRAFEEALERAISHVERGGDAALIMLDLDHLKSYNDERGHLDGDQALVNIALLLRTHMRAGDLSARLGGDEFAVLLEETTAEEALETAERMREAAAAAEFVPGARAHGLGISGGVVRIEGGVDLRTLIDRADAALYAAKNAGRNRIVVWEPSLVTAPVADHLSSRVRGAFVEDGFSLVFQPVVRLADGSVTYFESLVRMHVDGGETLSPQEFLPVVERIGLMPRLTRRVVELALWQLASTPGAAVSVNLSASDLGDAALLDEIELAVASAEAARGRLLFEIGEATLLANLGGGRAWMERLARHGCRFVLDDFGTGMGMFVLLREPHIEQIKLSRTVIRALGAAESNRAFVAALRELVEAQGKSAVAAFVETEQLLGDVLSAGFEWGQGYSVREPDGDLALLYAESVRR